MTSTGGVDATRLRATEAWLPVAGHDGIYEVSDLGHVRSLNRVNWATSRRGTRYQRILKGRVLRPSTAGKYLCVTLWSDHECRVVGIHILVLEAFVGPRPPGLYGCHLDDVRANNFLTNLYWGTPTQNCQDKIRHGRQPRGSGIPWAKLTEADVANIRAMKGAVKQKAIGEMYGIGQSQVSRLHAGLQWRHIAPAGELSSGAQA